MTGLVETLALLAASVWIAGAVYLTLSIRPQNAVGWATCTFWPPMVLGALLLLTAASLIAMGDDEIGG